MRHLIDPLDFTLEETTKVLDLADRIAENPEVYSHVANGKKIATGYGCRLWHSPEALHTSGSRKYRIPSPGAFLLQGQSCPVHP